EELGYDVKKLMRIRVMNIKLGDLSVGKWRELTKQEIVQLKKRLNINVFVGAPLVGAQIDDSEKRILFE
ncbi:MAG: hypothetical protein AAB664_02905, partial [Patescibacteria group bacterium]